MAYDIYEWNGEKFSLVSDDNHFRLPEPIQDGLNKFGYYLHDCYPHAPDTLYVPVGTTEITYNEKTYQLGD